MEGGTPSRSPWTTLDCVYINLPASKESRSEPVQGKERLSQSGALLRASIHAPAGTSSLCYEEPLQDPPPTPSHPETQHSFTPRREKTILHVTARLISGQGRFIYCLPKLNEVILFDLFTPVDKQSQGSKVRPTVLGKPKPLVEFFDPLFKPVMDHSEIIK